jgi:hypothetical protein
MGRRYRVTSLEVKSRWHSKGNLVWAFSFGQILFRIRKFFWQKLRHAGSALDFPVDVDRVASPDRTSHGLECV